MKVEDLKVDSLYFWAPKNYPPVGAVFKQSDDEDEIAYFYWLDDHQAASISYYEVECEIIPATKLAKIIYGVDNE